jgi:hypothetical protein
VILNYVDTVHEILMSNSLEEGASLAHIIFNQLYEFLYHDWSLV